MDILLYKDGHLSISESPLQGKENNLDDVVMLVSNPEEGDTLTYKGGKWVNGEGGGGGGGGGMMLTLTVTDEVGTLDATYAQVKAAFLAGTEVYYVYDNGIDIMRYEMASCQDSDAYDPNGVNFYAGHMGMVFTAGTEDDLLTAHM